MEHSSFSTPCIMARLFSMITLSVILLIQWCVLVNSAQTEIDLDIPWPSGIIIDRMENPHNGEIYRFGRLQYNAVQMRPHWSQIHVIENVITREEGQSIIKKAEDYAAEHGWSKGRHVDYAIRPTKDLPVRTLYPTDEDFAWLQERFENKLWVQYQNYFNINNKLLRIDDLFITKYIANSTNENSLAPHLDKSPWSFVIGLNDDFSEGGTFFVDHKKLWRPPVGAAVIFNGKQYHGAYPIKDGVRYIMAGFCDYGKVDQTGNEAHNEFMALYDEAYDGYAGNHGFRTGDLITGIEVCFKEQGDDHSAPVRREMRAVTGRTSDDEWVQYAQSCEALAPGTNTRLRVRRVRRNESPAEDL